MQTHFKVLHSDVLNHLDANDAIKRPFPLCRHVAVVDKMDLHSITSVPVFVYRLPNSRFLDSSLHVRQLLDRKCDSIHCRVGNTGRDVTCERAPTGSDLQYLKNILSRYNLGLPLEEMDELTR